MTISRRALVRGTAWAAPAISIAAAAPAFAASSFVCSGAMFCKKQNRQDGSKWDFEFAPSGCTNGTVGSVTVNGKVAMFVPATQTRGAYWVLRKQPHSYTWIVVVRDLTGTIGYSKTVDVRTSTCPA